MKKIMKIKIILFFSTFLYLQTYGQDIAINEFMSSNGITIADEDGDYDDWIEIYNYGSESIDLNGYGLSDNEDDVFKWVFPNITIQPKAYMIIWASGKNRKDINQPLHTNFKISAGGEELVLTKASGRKLSEVPATELERDTSFGRNPDGTGSFIVYNNATPNASNTGGTSGEPEKLVINEFITLNETINTDENGDPENWIEIYNYGTETVNLSGFGLSNQRDNAFRWVFPSVTIAPNQFLLVWASGKNRKTNVNALHTNFTLQNSDDIVYITNNSGILVDGKPVVYMEPDISYGRDEDGDGSWSYFDVPTPNMSNNESKGFDNVIVAPEFSHSSGLHTAAFDLVLTSENIGATIVYTLDGSEPDINNVSGTSYSYKNDYPYNVGESTGSLLTGSYTSKIYTSPINVTDISNQVGNITTKNTVQDNLYTPPTPVRKATVIKARTFVNGIGSEIKSKTFFVWSGGNPYNLPIISLQTNEKHLFDYNDGIYTAGVDFDNWRVENPTNNQSYRPNFSNYWRSGSDWEFPVTVQVFNKNLESIMNTDAGFRIHGNNSRGDIIKNLRLYARTDYGDEDFDLKIFDEIIPSAPDASNDNFQRLLLRGNGSGGYIANDVVFTRLNQPIFNGTTRIQTAIHFFNGEYWGVTAFRDRFDRFHFANNFDLNPDDIVIVDCKAGSCEIDEGNSDDYDTYRSLRNFINDNDMANSANYDAVKNQLDIDSFINHVLLSIFAEDDSYEIKYWKTRTKVNDGFGDGKWRLTTQDFEASLGSSENWLEKYTDIGGSNNNSLIGNLLVNTDFKNRFINRFADVLNTAYKKERLQEVIEATFNEIDPLLDEDENRAPRSRFFSGSDKTRLMDWSEERYPILESQMLSLFSLSGTLTLDLDISDPRAGYIKLNTIDVLSTTTGVDSNAYPWSGKYFNNVPVTIEAVELPGYVFSNWSGSSNSTSRILEITPTQSLQLKANYTQISDFAQVIHFWLMDDNLPNDKPLENMFSTYSRNTEKGELTYTSSLSGYPFDNTDLNWRRASLERINAPSSINYKSVANNDITYSDEVMRGLQVKQPFRSGSLENTINLSASTLNYKDIKLSFVMKSDGAAQSVIVDYWNGSAWVTSGLPSSELSIGTEYQLKQIDFTNISFAANNDDFRIRIRFNGSNMTEDGVKKVFLNSIAIEGEDDVLSNDEFDTLVKDLKVYPNPVNNQLKIQAGEKIDKIIIYNTFGKTIYMNNAIKSESLSVDMSSFSSGLYLLQVSSGNSLSTKKIIKK